MAAVWVSHVRGYGVNGTHAPYPVALFLSIPLCNSVSNRTTAAKGGQVVSLVSLCERQEPKK